MNYLDLFSGIGGFHKGFCDAGWKFDKVYYSEIDKYAQQIYARHFPDAIPLGDVTKIDGTKLDKIDLITFGFPCQDLSIAGKRRGLAGSRSGLFYEATRLIRECQPDIFIFENVKGLLTSNKGEDFESVLREIADMRLYECEWQLVNTKWVLPQNRERIYFIGHLAEAGRCGGKVFPIGIECEEIDGILETQQGSGERVRGEVSRTDNEYVGVEARGGAGKRLNKIGTIGKDSQGNRVYGTNGDSAQLTSQGGGWGAKTGLYEINDNPQPPKA